MLRENAGFRWLHHGAWSTQNEAPRMKHPQWSTHVHPPKELAIMYIYIYIIINVIHILYTYYTHIIHILYTYHTHLIHISYTYHSHIIHILYIHYEDPCIVSYSMGENNLLFRNVFYHISTLKKTSAVGQIDIPAFVSDYRGCERLLAYVASLDHQLESGLQILDRLGRIVEGHPSLNMYVILYTYIYIDIYIYT